ncbi:A-kinase anchor protein 14 [Calypte anna]|uniref:A-kinase anchor protein 14 n=1 Tax=Calypte anna TaxID=9244 RepID=UPI0011C35A63|nr:A-kinase anchor protein 14 [Calypte anna]
MATPNKHSRDHRVKTTDEGVENAASEEQTSHSDGKWEKQVFPEGFISIFSILETKSVTKDIQWITGEDFTVERGKEQIEELISTWEVHESWLYWSEFLREEELKDSKRYHYRVCWSVPTRRKPIPRATASIYFVIEISKIKPATSPVEVFFTLESSRLIHR